MLVVIVNTYIMSCFFYINTITDSRNKVSRVNRAICGKLYINWPKLFHTFSEIDANYCILGHFHKYVNCIINTDLLVELFYSNVARSDIRVRLLCLTKSDKQVQYLRLLACIP